MRNDLTVWRRRRRASGAVAAAALAILISADLMMPQEALAATGSGTISTIAGSNAFGAFAGDGGPATAAALDNPYGVAVMPDGGYVIADTINERIRRVFPDGTIKTIAGTGNLGFSGDGGPATAAELRAPISVAAMPDGSVLIADPALSRIRRVSPTGTITTVAGNGTFGFSGDGGPATAAQIWAPNGVAAMPDGGFLIADTGNSRVRRVFPDGTIKTIAGTGTDGFSGDGGPATAAQLDRPYSVAPTGDGGFVIADTANLRVRRVSAAGTITTVAGTGVQGTSGDGGAATAAQFLLPSGVASTPDGGVLVTDYLADRVRRVSPTGVITTVAGTGAPGIFVTGDGDGGPATAADISRPFQVAVTASGDFVFAEQGNSEIRFVDADFAGTPSATTAPGAPTIGSATSGNASATVRWTAPATDGGSAVTGYLVRVLDSAGAQVGALRTAGPTATSLVVTGLTNGSSYQFQVAAMNDVGTSPNSGLSTAVVPATAPGAPVIGTAASGTAGGAVTATAHWNIPATNGGSAVTGYVVRALRMSTSGAVLATTTSAQQPASARQLTMTLPTGSYRFTVQAINKAGSGPESARSNQVTAR